MHTFFQVLTPQTIVYGQGAFGQVGKEAASRGKKALIISDGIINELGHVEKCRQHLWEEGISSHVFLDIKSEPTDQYVSDSLAVLEKESCDMVISLGGGSCIDTAKAIAVLAANGGYIGDYMGGRKKASKPALPHIAIPTTAGTGSEATDVTVITNTSNDVKMMIKQPAFMPSAAIVDPFLSLSSPKQITAATGVDALSHAIEAYLSKKAHPMTDTFALAAVKLISENLEIAFHNGEDLKAREAMAIGAMYAGIAFSNASVCLVHGMSRPIGALFHVPHGISNAMLLPAVLEFSKEACVNRLADIGRIFEKSAEGRSNAESAEQAVKHVKKICRTLAVPNLEEWGIDKNQFEKAVSKMSDDALASGSPDNNPRVPNKQEIQDLYRICFQYKFVSGEENSEIIV